MNFSKNEIYLKAFQQTPKQRVPFLLGGLDAMRLPRIEGRFWDEVQWTSCILSKSSLST